MKDLRALAQQIKVVPGSVEDTRTGTGESVRESPLVGNTVRAGKIPCQKKIQYGSFATSQGDHICDSCEAFEKKVRAMLGM